MARPIKDTPILKGEDVVIFLDNMLCAENKKTDIAKKKRIKTNFDKLKAISIEHQMSSNNSSGSH